MLIVQQGLAAQIIPEAENVAAVIAASSLPKEDAYQVVKRKRDRLAKGATWFKSIRKK